MEHTLNLFADWLVYPNEPGIFACILKRPVHFKAFL